MINIGSRNQYCFILISFLKIYVPPHIYLKIIVSYTFNLVLLKLLISNKEIMIIRKKSEKNEIKKSYTHTHIIKVDAY